MPEYTCRISSFSTENHKKSRIDISENKLEISRGYSENKLQVS